MKKTTFFKNKKIRNDIILAAVILVIAVAGLLIANLTKTQGDFAVVKIDGIEKVEPMSYPFKLDDVCLRDDEVEDELEIDDILQNSGSNLYNQVKLPKVVE